MEFKKGTISASLEALVIYDTLARGAFFEILVEKGVTTKVDVPERLAKLNEVTQTHFDCTQ